MGDFQVKTIRKARKPHRCCECHGLIVPGQSYEHVAGVWDGGADRFKTCMHCVEAREWAIAQKEWSWDGEHLFCFEALGESLAGLAPEIYPGDGRRFRAYRLRCEMQNRRRTSVQH
ncbi:hypothetical protein PSm6_00480 [Pseudomonas solani]|uniref:Uncharacterized protein n=1 Tax=Pseudomonas solani TaxID=2731552 RepID=A0ABM7L290_9PSED|nr:hypothetical protein [Pseudomonas solani]BCD83641.1 hypothetical protein PSm6_00480 [Pseudomonas solani]